MVAEWIKVRRGLRQFSKTVIIARNLEETEYFKNLLLSPNKKYKQALQRHKFITSEIARHVTVSALVDVWVALNDVVDKNCRVENMRLCDIDAMAGLPGFGSFMGAVQWVEEDSKGLLFRHFDEWNIPDSQRPFVLSDAQRAKNYRDRKREQLRHERHETSRLEEKSREEKRRGDLHLQHWDDFLSVWQNGKGKPYDSKNFPPVWSTTTRDAAWLEQAKKALAHLPNCKYFVTPMTLTQFLQRGRIEQILGGEFDDAPRQKKDINAPLPPKGFTGEAKEAFERTRKHLESKRQ